MRFILEMTVIVVPELSIRCDPSDVCPSTAVYFCSVYALHCYNYNTVNE